MKNSYVGIIVMVVLIVGYSEVSSMNEKTEKQMNNATKTETAVFAGGCFWCTESDFEKVDGVIEVISGYTGGNKVNPKYEEVSEGGTGHVEAVQVVYDPAKITYGKLLDIFWRHVDPTDGGGQFVDRGSQYRSVIFYSNEKERRLAEASKKRLAETGPFDNPVVTDILALGSFYPAEDYHQNYYKKNPIRYRWYRHGSGRDQFLEKIWAGRGSDMMTDIKKQGAEETPSDGQGMANEPQMPPGKNSAMKNGDLYSRPDEATLRSRLTDMQYQVTRQNGTEPPFKNAYWDNHEAGIYVDIVSGEPLFSSTDKFESGTGWPSFLRTLEPGNIVEKSDRSFFMVRTEVRSKHADSHLGHLFNDGPKPTGLRYCINSAALRFIPAADLDGAGYGKYRRLFE